MLVDCFIGQLVEAARRDIVLELLVPFFSVERKEPFAKFRELVRGQFRDRLFELLKRHM